MKYTHWVVGVLMIILFLILVYFGFSRLNAQEKPLVVVVPSYNNAQWYERNLSSVFEQKYDNYRVIYIDDSSTDNTYELVKNYITQHGYEHKVTLIKNETRQGAMANHYKAVYMCKDNEIIVDVDGDDFLKHDQVLQVINKTYDDKNTWMTYGQYEEYPSTERATRCHAIPPVVIQHNAYRQYHWVTSHLRTYYAWLFKKIKKEDLFYKGEFFPINCDQAFMFPMLEMAAGRVKFIPEILYVYNMATPLNEYKQRLQLIFETERVIRQMAKYEPLDKTLVPNEVDWLQQTGVRA